MTDREMAAALRGFPLGALCNAHPDVRAMHASIAPLFCGASMSGPAKTARISPGQNAAIHRAVHTAAPGDVLVVAAGGDTAHGPFGDILATCCLNKGIAGLVIDSAIRDVEEIRKLRFPAFCLGANPTGTQKVDPGDIDLEIICAGARVRPGDFIVGRGDGVVIVPRDAAVEIVDLAEAVLEKERTIMTRLAEGRTTCEIFGIDPAARATRRDGI